MDCSFLLPEIRWESSRLGPHSRGAGEESCPCAGLFGESMWIAPRKAWAWGWPQLTVPPVFSYDGPLG